MIGIVTNFYFFNCKCRGKLCQGSSFSITMLQNPTAELPWVVPHPPYSPDPIPSDFICFDTWKNRCVEECSRMIMSHYVRGREFEDQEASFYLCGYYWLGEEMNQVYWAGRGLCWKYNTKIKMYFIYWLLWLNPFWHPSYLLKLRGSYVIHFISSIFVLLCK